MEIIDFEGAKLYKWNIGASTFLASPLRGARLMNWNLSMADGSVRDVIYWPENAPMGEGFPSVRGGNPILFPFAGRSHLKGEQGKWKTKDERVLDMPQHGFARQSDFELIDTNDFGFTARLIPNAQAMVSYPYKYEFLVKYRFSQFSFAVDLQLSNKDLVDIPMCAGHHFYFRLPWHDNATRSDYTIKIDAKKAATHLPNGEISPVAFEKEFDFGDASAINRLHYNLKSNIVKFGSKNGEEDISITIGNSPRPEKYETIVTWSESPTAPYYCVEPWMGLPNSAEHGMGLSWVAPSESKVFSTEVSLL